MDHLSKVINHGLTKASQQYTQELYDSEFARDNLPPPPLFPVLDIFTPNGFSSNFGLEQVVKRVNGNVFAKTTEDEDEKMETECDSDYSMHSICAKCSTDFAPFFTQQKIDDKVELLCRDCHIRWREEQDRERKNQLQAEMIHKVTRYIESIKIREEEILKTKERLTKKKARVQECFQQLDKSNVTLPRQMTKLLLKESTEQQAARTKEELTKLVTKRALESLRKHFQTFAAKTSDPTVPGLHEQINTMSDLERFIT